jgi:hypothetical protein
VGTFLDSLREQVSDPKAYRKEHGTIREALRGDPAAKVDRLQREAEKKDKRALKMSKKHVLGNMRSRNAATTAENLHNQADRLRQSQADKADAARQAEDARLTVRREAFKRTGSYDG